MNAVILGMVMVVVMMAVMMLAVYFQTNLLLNIHRMNFRTHFAHSFIIKDNLMHPLLLSCAILILISCRYACAHSIYILILIQIIFSS